MATLSLDIGSNSVGSAWIDRETGQIWTGTSIFPAGVDESDDKRGEPKNATRRMARRARITLGRRAERKRELRQRLIADGLLPADAAAFKVLLEETDPWTLRCHGLDGPLTPHEFGRCLLHLAQRRGALGLRIPDATDDEDADDKSEDGKVKKSIGEVRTNMLQRKARTFGEFMAMVREERVTKITSKDKRPINHRRGPREYRDAIRNKKESYEHCADRAMIRDEFAELWKRQVQFGGATARLLTEELRDALDGEPKGKDATTWRHMGLMFGQRRATWDLGTLGRCVLHPSERCVPHADMYASRFRVVETVNNLRIIERRKEKRPLTPEERENVMAYLCGPLGMYTPPKKKGKAQPPRPKTTVSVTDLRNLMGWGRASKTTPFHFNIEADEDREINTDWFSREIVHGAVTPERWANMEKGVREGLNRAILKFDPDHEEDAEKLKAGAMDWAGLSEDQADALVNAWKRRPKPDAKRLNMSRRAVRNILTVMDRPEPWPEPDQPDEYRWLTQIEARKLIAEDAEFEDVTTGETLDDHTRRRYATGAKGATARDRYYMRKHILTKNGKPIIGPDGQPLAEPPPAPMISNPVVRKAIHEVRRHLVEYMTTFERKPDEVYVELAREAKMGKKDADRLLFRNRLRNRVRNDIVREFDLESSTSTHQRTAVERVVLCVQQGGICPLCGKAGLTPRMAAFGEGCEVSHILPKASGGHNGFGNIVLGHTGCNQRMSRRTPRQFWSEDGPGFDNGMRWIEGIYGEVKRPKSTEIKGASGEALWSCYFKPRDDKAKIEQFKKDIKDTQGMTLRQMAATSYASRQVMAYLADAVYDGKGLPERGGDRKIFASDGMWTGRLRREWGLFFDPHDRRAKGLSVEEAHERKEKDRGDHRHHAIDAVVIALCTQRVRDAWEKREKQADTDGVNTADQEAMDDYRRRNPLPLPEPYSSRDKLRDAVRRAVYGDGGLERPICHRPEKRKLVGKFHEAFPRGPVLNNRGELTDRFTKKIGILALKQGHLRVLSPESEKEAIDRLAERRQLKKDTDQKTARKWAKALVESPAYVPTMVDPLVTKGGLVRDYDLRTRLRECLSDAGIDPEKFDKSDVKAVVDAGGMKQKSGVPIHSAVLLWVVKDAVITSRWAADHATGKRFKEYDAATGKGDARAVRAYIGGENHHIEIRVNDKGKWSGEIVSAFEAAQRNLARLKAFREAGIPKLDEFRKLPRTERRRFRPILAQIEREHSIVDRSNDDKKGGRFIMSLCIGEMLLMKHKDTMEVGYFVVAKLDPKQSIVLVPHWDARAAGERKDSEGRKIPDSTRDEFSVTPSGNAKYPGLKDLAPPNHPHVLKIRVSPMGEITMLEKD